MRPKFEVADVIRNVGQHFVNQYPLSYQQLKTLRAIEQCRTPALGGHLYACNDCGVAHPAYNSCRNRNCPKCQALEREAWMIARKAELLPVPYFHVVFTIPEQLNILCRYNESWMYDLLFATSWKVLQQFAANPKWLGAKTGATMILHTWGQNLSLHPHIHCIVPGGGLNKQNKWIHSKKGQFFLFPVEAMTSVFKAIFLKALFNRIDNGLLSLPPGFPNGKGLRKFRQLLYAKSWVAYAKRPFGGPPQVIEYLGRYTHKIAISNQRLINVTDHTVSFTYKSYQQNGKKLTMQLEANEFLRRFCLHILPARFRRIRHYGILSNAAKKKDLDACRKSLRVLPPPEWGLTRKERRKAAAENLLDRHQRSCPVCKTGTLILVGTIPEQDCSGRGPPGFKGLQWYPNYKTIT